MTKYLGDIADTGQVLRFRWTTNLADGAAGTRTTAGTVTVYRDADTVGDTAGVTDTVDWNGITGVHLCEVNTTGAYYELGADYSVVLTGAQVDGVTPVVAVLAEFSIRNRSERADVISWQGVALTGVNMTQDQSSSPKWTADALRLAPSGNTGGLAEDVWDYDGTGGGNPGDGKWRANTGTFGSMTSIRFSEISGRDANRTLWLTNLESGDRISISEVGGSAFGLFDVTGAPTDNGGYWTIPVSSTDSSGSASGESACMFQFNGQQVTQQEIRDAMKLAPTAGAPSLGSVDQHLDDIQAQTDLLPPDPASEATVASENASTRTQGGAGPWTTAAGFSTHVPGDVWEETRATHTTAGTFGEGVASVQGDVTGNVDGTVAGVTPSTAGDAMDLVTDAVDADAIATTGGNKIADMTWRRQLVNIAASAFGDPVIFRAPIGAIRKLVNRVRNNSGVLETYDETDAVVVGTQNLTSDPLAEPIIEVDTV